MTVYITQDAPSRSFSPARKHGELELLFPAKAQVLLSAMPTYRKLQRAMKTFSDDDFVLLSGDPIIMALAINVALEANDGRAKILKWDRYLFDYGLIEMNLYEKEDLFPRVEKK